MITAPGELGERPHVLGYNVTNPSRSPDGHVEAFVADLYATEWQTGQVPEHASEDAVIIRTRESGAWRVEARTCGQPDHPGWCELRIRLHEHRRSPFLEELVDDEIKRMSEAPPDDEHA